VLGGYQFSLGYSSFFYPLSKHITFFKLDILTGYHIFQSDPNINALNIHHLFISHKSADSNIKNSKICLPNYIGCQFLFQRKFFFPKGNIVFFF
jgi:hypothetical protein